MSTPSPTPARDTSPEQWYTISFTAKASAEDREIGMALFKLPDGTAFEAAVCDCVTTYSAAFKEVEMKKYGKIQPFSRKRVEEGEFRPPYLNFVTKGRYAGLTQITCPYESEAKIYGCEFSMFAEHLPEPYRKDVYSYALSGRITTWEVPESLRLWYYILSQHDPSVERRVAISYITETRHISRVHDILHNLVGHTAENQHRFPDTDYRDAIKIVGTVFYLLNRWYDEQVNNRREAGRQPALPKRAPADHPEPERPFGKRPRRGYGARQTLPGGPTDPSGLVSTDDQADRPLTIEGGHPPVPNDPVWEALDPSKLDDWDFGRFAARVNKMFRDKWSLSRGAGVGRLGTAEEIAAALTTAMRSALAEVYPEHPPRVSITSGLLIAPSRAPSPLSERQPEGEEAGHDRLDAARRRLKDARHEVDRLKAKLAAAEAVAAAATDELAMLEEELALGDRRGTSL
ncbi:hypothetical protein JCM3774_001827 [Rhodotorula dairenensis]